MTNSRLTANVLFAARLTASTAWATGHNEGSVIAAIMIAHSPTNGPSGGRLIMPIAVI
jgi:hypothetical protein